MQHFLATSQYETSELHSLVFSGAFGFALPHCVAVATPNCITLFIKVMRDIGQLIQLQLHFFRNGGRN